MEWLPDSGALCVLAATLAWATLYLLLCLLDPKRSLEWHCRVVTTVHAATIVVLSGWSCFVEGPWPFTDPGGPNNSLQHWTCVVCLGYFIYDFLWCLYFQTEGAFMLGHHVLSITGLTVTLYYGLYGTEMMATILGTELSNPFLQLRWFLRHSGRRHTRVAVLADVAFMFLFGVLRIGVGSCLLYCYLRHPRPDWLGRAGGVCIYSVGWVFWVMIVKYAFNKYYKTLKRVSVKDETMGNGHGPPTSSQNGCVSDSTKNHHHSQNGRISTANKCD